MKIVALVALALAATGRRRRAGTWPAPAPGGETHRYVATIAAQHALNLQLYLAAVVPEPRLYEGAGSTPFGLVGQGAVDEGGGLHELRHYWDPVHRRGLQGRYQDAVSWGLEDPQNAHGYAALLQTCALRRSVSTARRGARHRSTPCRPWATSCTCCRTCGCRTTCATTPARAASGPRASSRHGAARTPCSRATPPSPPP